MTIYLGENLVAGSFKSGASWEVGDIGQAALGINESLNKRRYLNGQVISQTQFAQFTAWVKQRVSLYPSLATSEADWQTAVTNSPYGICGKFVIDDTVGTIRLPKYPDWIIREVGQAPVIGNGMTLGLTDGTNNRGLLGTSVSTLGYSGSGSEVYNKNVGTTTTGSWSSSGSMSLGITTDPTKSGMIADLVNANIEDRLPGKWFIQVAEGIENSVDVSREIELNNPFSLLDYKFSEYEITNASWLRSNGQYNSGTTYADVYNLLLQIYNGTVTKAGVSVKLSTETYTDTDFVLNTSDTTFRLPLKVALASGKAVAGNGMALGLTDGTNLGGMNSYEGTAGIRFQSGGYGVNVGTNISGNINNQKAIGVTTDQTKSGIETSANGLYLYFYVGAVVQDASVIAAASVLTQIANLSFDYVVESKTPTAEDPTWYRVYKSGWVEQGGTIASGTSSSTINLSKKYANILYRVVVNPTSTGANYTNNIIAYPVDENSFTWNSYNNTATTKSWEAKGQGA